jgi:Domain of unknown function (DUF4276)
VKVRYLSVALLTEGASDESFLVPVLRQQLALIGQECDFEVGPIRTSPVRMVHGTSQVDGKAAELLEECDLLFVHHDKNESPKVQALRDRLGQGSRIVAVVPVRETEAWILAAVYALNAPGLDPALKPEPVRSVEKTPDPKAALRRAYTRGNPIGDFERFGEQVDIAVLQQLPAYQTFLQDLTTALKELNFQ